MYTPFCDNSLYRTVQPFLIFLRCTLSPGVRLTSFYSELVVRYSSGTLLGLFWNKRNIVTFNNFPKVWVRTSFYIYIYHEPVPNLCLLFSLSVYVSKDRTNRFMYHSNKWRYLLPFIRKLLSSTEIKTYTTYRNLIGSPLWFLRQPFITSYSKGYCVSRCVVHWTICFFLRGFLLLEL